MASQITSLTIVYSTVNPGADQRKDQSCASLAFLRGIYRGPVNSPHKGPVTRKMFLWNYPITNVATLGVPIEKLTSSDNWFKFQKLVITCKPGYAHAVFINSIHLNTKFHLKILPQNSLRHSQVFFFRFGIAAMSVANQLCSRTLRMAKRYMDQHGNCIPSSRWRYWPCVLWEFLCNGQYETEAVVGRGLGTGYPPLPGCCDKQNWKP